MNSTKKTFLTSLMALLLCIVMLMGTTFAWFTDVVTSTGNIIQAGNLDAEMYYSESLDDPDWKNADGPAVFNYDKWEPGYTVVRYIKVKNAGKLNFKFQLSLDANGVVSKLGDVIDVYFVNPASQEIESLEGLNNVGVLTNVIKNSNYIPGTLTPGSEVILAIALHMQESAGNEYQGLELCEGGFDLKLIATQVPGESDSFGDDYDDEATWEDTLPEQSTASSEMELNADGTLPVDLTFANDDGTISITVPAGTKFKQGTTLANLNVNKLATSGANITLEENEETRSFDVHVANLDDSNTEVISIAIKEFLPAGLNMGNYQLYHVEDGQTLEMQLLADGEAPVHNSFNYDPATGDVVLHLASFSEVTLVADTENKWNGDVDHSWYVGKSSPYTIANADQLWSFSQIVGNMAEGIEQDSFSGKTVKLISDINLGDAEADNNPDIIFYPIGYWNNEGTYERKPLEERTTAVESGFYNFCGTFDGNGNTISNFYQNTWEMKGDHNWYDPIKEQYYRDGMGLFGRVYKGTIKNLTVKNFSSDGEIATTGVIAAYADGATFENIAIVGCNPRVYNIGNGGIVGCVGWYAKEANLKTTFKNITVDNSNKISALWGSYDVACGGIVGQYYPTSGQSSVNYPVNGGIHFENCHISAQMDVYNDVCANYQYYAYRYTGMLIGSVRENVTIDGHSYPKMDGITAKDCTVHFGTWNDYYYCEIIDNTTASYTHDYQMSRLTEIKAIDGTTITYLDGTTGTVPASGRANYVIVDYSKGHGTENATCYHFKDGEVWSHEDGGTETINGVEVLKEDKQHIYLEFNNLVTGYGWGVTSRGFDNLDGVENLDIDEGTHEESVNKFSPVIDNNTEFATESTVTIGQLFGKVENAGVAIKSENVQVTVSPFGATSTAGGTYVANTTDWTQGTLTFSGLGDAVITITDYYFCNTTSITVKVIGAEKFDTNFVNYKNYLYRVGNADKSTVALGTIFKHSGKGTINSASVDVTFETVAGNASGSFIANKIDWTKGTIQFTGTGVVKVSIKDDTSKEFVLNLEVVDAVNATGAMNATSNNVVLLNDISSGFTVSNGYAFYGNGFKITCSGKGSALNATGMSLGYINVTSGGILDNVQVICDIYPAAYLYANEVQVNSNIDDSYNIAGKTYYLYQLSAVAISGNSTISNSYIYGARNNIFVGAGDVNILNTVVECGSVSNIHIKSSDVYTVTLDNVTTIQHLESSKYDTSKNVMGFGVLIGDNESETNAKVVLKGDLKQYNWVNKSHYTGDNAISNTYAKTAIELALDISGYQHTIGNVTTINMGIAILNAKNFNYEDNRINKNTIPYIHNDITMLTYKGQVYSITSNSVIDESNRFDPEIDGALPYIPTTNGIIAPSIGHNGTNGSSLTISTEYNNRWVTTFKADLDNIASGSYTFKFSDLVVKKNGVELSVTIKDSNGNTIDKNTAITLNQLATNNYTLVVTDNQIYNANGELSGNSVTHEMPFVLYATKTSIEPPKFSGIGSGVDGAIRLVSSAGGNWRPAYPALEGVSVEYWSASESKVKTIDLATLTNSGTISGQTWTYTCEDFTLTITGGPVHTTTSYVISPMIATRDGKSILYFAGANKDNSTGTTARLICLQYVFTDKNASTTVGQCTTYSNGIATVQYANLPEYSWSSFQKGTVEEVSSGGGSTPCVTPDTLITLADGTQVRVDSLTGDEMLLVWNHETGALESVPVAYIVDHEKVVSEREIVHLTFSNGKTVKMIGEHVFFDATLNKYVAITSENADAFIGHKFVALTDDGTSVESVELISVEREIKETEVYEVVSYKHLTCFTEGILSTSAFLDPLLNVFDIDEETLTYDMESVQNDIETYGLYTYADFEGLISEEAFELYNAQYLKIAVGKGYITWDDILELIDIYFDAGVTPIAE